MLTGMENMAADATDAPAEVYWDTSSDFAPDAAPRGKFAPEFFTQVELPSARWLKQAIDA
jgi:hypothetical protein